MKTGVTLGQLARAEYIKRHRELVCSDSDKDTEKAWEDYAREIRLAVLDPRIVKVLAVD